MAATEKNTLKQQLEEENKGLLFTPEKENKNNVKGLVTPAQIDKWKAAHVDGLYGVMTNKHIAYFRYPTRDEINDAIVNQVEGDPFSAYAQMANMTFLGGSVDVLTSDRLFATAIHKIKGEIDGNAEVLNF